MRNPASSQHLTHDFTFSPLLFAFFSLAIRISTAFSPRNWFEIRLRFFLFASALAVSMARNDAVVGANATREVLLATTVVVVIAFAGVVECSVVISIEFEIYLRSISTTFGSRLIYRFLLFQTNQHFSKTQNVMTQTLRNALSTRVSRTKTDRNRNY